MYTTIHIIIKRNLISNKTYIIIIINEKSKKWATNHDDNDKSFSHSSLWGGALLRLLLRLRWWSLRHFGSHDHLLLFHYHVFFSSYLSTCLHYLVLLLLYHDECGHLLEYEEHRTGNVTGSQLWRSFKHRLRSREFCSEMQRKLDAIYKEIYVYVCILTWEETLPILTSSSRNLVTDAECFFRPASLGSLIKICNYYSKKP